ncbi:MAG: aminoglycoside phosphotransferase family protein [Clostridia bacterium]|jgi:thiamine kinase-like enzyme|nr:aminoglycoside phosphotransferase family protein [Clostridia bacterium]
MFEIVSENKFFKGKDIAFENIKQHAHLVRTIKVIDKETGEKYVARFNTEGYEDTVEKEYGSLKHINEYIDDFYLNIIYSDKDILVTKYFESKNLIDINEEEFNDKEGFVAKLKGRLDELHRLPAYRPDGEMSWYETYLDLYNKIVLADPENIFTLEEKEMLNKTLEKYTDYLKNVDEVFLQGDVNWPNIIYTEGGEEAYIIDYELSCSGDKLYDYVWLVDRDDSFITKEFLKYEELKNFKNSGLYLLYSLIPKGRWIVSQYYKHGMYQDEDIKIMKDMIAKLGERV